LIIEQTGSRLHVPHRRLHETQRIAVRAVGQIGPEDGPIEQGCFVIVIAVDGSGPVKNYNPVDAIARRGGPELPQGLTFQ